MWPARSYNIFPHYLLNATIFGKKFIEQKISVLFSLQHMSQTFLILRRNERDVTKMYTGLHMKYRYSCQFLTYFDFLDTFSENSQISDSMKISPVEAELFHADGDRQVGRQT